MKPTILAFTSFYLPGYRGGGPIRTIANMVERLGDDFNFLIITSDRDLGDAKAYPSINVDAWNVVGKAKVFYASSATHSFCKLARLTRRTPHDLIYLNSFFSPRYTLQPVIAKWLGLIAQRPLVIAPRGEFSVGALRIKSWKKKPFIRLARIIGLFSGVTWHASTQEEAIDIEKAFIYIDRPVQVARNIAIAADLLQDPNTVPDRVHKSNERSQNNALQVCFLSRIAEMKNLAYALEVLSLVKIPVHFKIYGPKEDLMYWQRCQVLIEGLPKHIQVTYGGSVAHDEVKKIIEPNDIFFVPSRGENFGHVFMESLSVGVPILVSDRTPWRDLSDKGIGWDIPLDQSQRFADAIEMSAQLNLNDRRKVRQQCISFARAKAEDPLAVESNRELFLKIFALNR